MLKAVKNYNVEAATRKGKPNAFGYFTQISWYAFVRRIQKENKQQEIKLKYLAESGIEEFLIDADEDPAVSKAVQSFVDSLRKRIDDVKEKDRKIDEKIKRGQAIDELSQMSQDMGLYDLHEQKEADSELSAFFQHWDRLWS